MTDTASDLPEGCALVHLEEVDSTNAEAMRRVLAGERGPMWITADRQTAGRGRSGRAWSSTPGNLLASFIVQLDCAPAMAAQLSLVAGIATIDAIRRAGTLRGLRLKWPNDILVGTAKAGGILVESTSRPGQPGTIAVIGVPKLTAYEKILNYYLLLNCIFLLLKLGLPLSSEGLMLKLHYHILPECLPHQFFRQR